MTRIIKDVVVQDSPKWLKDKIESMGLKSINNLVDLSNYILFELNQLIIYLILIKYQKILVFV